MLQLSANHATGQVLWDNGPFYNSVGTGANGANESVLYSSSLGMALIAYGTNTSRLADDFEINACHWRIDSMVVYGYQLYSGLTSTISGCTWRLWDGQPDLVGSTVVLGDPNTNRLLASRWSGAYRVWEGNNGSPDRPIMRIVMDGGGVIINGGHFWLDWTAEGTLGSTWFAPRTPVGQTTTGNALQFMNGSWGPCIDRTGTEEPQGLPFIIYGSLIDPVADAGPNRSICLNDSTVLGGSPTVTGGYGPVTVQWTPATDLNSTTSLNPVSTPAVNTTYILTVTDSSGCTDTDTVGVGLGALSANLLATDTTLCDGTTMAIDAGPGLGFQWSTGDTVQSLVVGPGTYYVDVDNGTSCPHTDTIVVNPQQHTFIAGYPITCIYTPDSLFAVGNFTSYAWSTGETSPWIIINLAGTWSVTTTDRFGCISEDTITTSAYPPVTASFSYTVSGGGLTYNFINTSQNATAWEWDFGDGDSSMLQNPTHTYANYGTYNVRLKAENACYNQIFPMAVTATGIADQLPLDIILSPQPVTDHLRLQASGLQQAQLHVTLSDLQGRHLQSWTWENPSTIMDERLEIRPLPHGLYLLTLHQANQSTVRKVLIGN